MWAGRRRALAARLRFINTTEIPEIEALMLRYPAFAKKQHHNNLFIKEFLYISKYMCQIGHILLSFQACCASIVAILSEAFLLRGVIAKR